MNIEITTVGLTTEERREVARSVASSIRIGQDFIRPEMKTTYRFEPKVLRRIKQTEKRLPALKSALKKLKSFEKS